MFTERNYIILFKKVVELNDSCLAYIVDLIIAMEVCDFHHCLHLHVTQYLSTVCNDVLYMLDTDEAVIVLVRHS